MTSLKPCSLPLLPSDDSSSSIGAGMRHPGTPISRAITKSGSIHPVIVFLLSMMVVVWVAQNEFAQMAETSTCTVQPFIIVWVNHVIMILPLPFVIWYECQRTALRWRDVLAKFLQGFGSRQRCLWVSLLATTLYFACNYCQYCGIQYVPIGIANAIFNGQVVFTFTFGVCLIKDSVTLAKVASLAIVVMGVICVGLFDCNDRLYVYTQVEGANAMSSLFGNAILIASSAMFGLYAVLFKKFIGDRGVCDTLLFVGVIGIGRLVLFWPGVAVSNYYHPLTEMLPCLGSFVMQAALGLVFNLLFMLCISLTQPVLVSMAWLMAIPLSYVVDSILFGKDFGTIQIAGAGFVMLGFTLYSALGSR